MARGALSEQRVVTPDMVGFSTGGKGEQPRSFDRTYNNWGGQPIENADTFIAAFNAMEKPSGPRHRRVLRALTTPSVANELATDRAGTLRGAVEVAVPVRTSEGPLYIVGAAYNAPGRNGEGTQPEKTSDFPNGVVPYSNPARSLEDHVKRAASNGIRFVSTMDNERVFNRVGELWQTTYGWPDEGLADLRERLGRESDDGFSSDQRSVFLTGAVDAEGKLAAVTMAEALPLELPGGQTFMLWESTEWVTDPEVPINGLVSASAALTHGQIAAAYGERGNLTIIAETNRTTPAGAVARSAGMRAPRVSFEVVDHEGPDRIHVAPPQVLEYNVGVNDGRPADGPEMIEDGRAFPLRSFDLYQAPPQVLEELALPANVALTRRTLSRV